MTRLLVTTAPNTCAVDAIRSVGVFQNGRAHAAR